MWLLVILQMYNSCQKCICPPDNTAVKYTTGYTLHPPDDCQAYLVLQDYTLQLVPTSMTIELGNLFNGNKVLGELASCVLQNTTTASNGNWQFVYLYVSGNEANKYLNDNMDTVLSDVGPHVFDSLGLIIHKIFSQAATTVLYKDIFNDIECDVN
jgi:hypothetical protein